MREDAPLGELEKVLPGAQPGERVWLGLRSALSAAHLIADLEVANPAAESMLRRLLTGLAVRVGGLDVTGREDWEERFDALLTGGRFDPGAVDAYFDRWLQRFDLFDGRRPFMQDPRLAEECSKQAPPGRLVMPRPSGANQPWLDRTPQGEPVPAGEALGWLLAWRGYGPSGLGAQRRHASVNSKNMKAAPLRALVSFHPLGESLFASLVLSCPPPSGFEGAGADLAPWERDDLEDPLAPAAVSGPMALLTGRSTHHVLLAPSVDGSAVTGCWVAWGSRVDLPAARDPFVIDRAKGGPVRASWRRQLLRDFDAFVHARDPAAAGIKGQILPVWLSVFADLPPDVLEVLAGVRVRALGCHQEKQDRDEHWYAATTPASIAPFLPSQHPQRAARVARTRLAAELAAADMAKVLRSAWKEMAPGDKGCAWADAATSEFWDRADPLFWSAIAQDEAGVPQFRGLGLEIFDSTTREAAASPQGLLPVARARSSFTHPRSGRKKS
ncbi:type I-E CRISPR-associated protein Cse1/CasA [Streptomyces sp. NPDC060334]|uniref:type I-E CRISPR-associated protein Cse1/CasA n=1 Tax=Streptomyces sp. NPDC060334 TaxID=3347099 RepID=UPI00364F613B